MGLRCKSLLVIISFYASDTALLRCMNTVPCRRGAPGRLQLVASVGSAELLHSAVCRPRQLQSDVRPHARVGALAIRLHPACCRAEPSSRFLSPSALSPAFALCLPHSIYIYVVIFSENISSSTREGAHARLACLELVQTTEAMPSQRRHGKHVPAERCRLRLRC